MLGDLTLRVKGAVAFYQRNGASEAVLIQTVLAAVRGMMRHAAWMLPSHRYARHHHTLRARAAVGACWIGVLDWKTRDRARAARLTYINAPAASCL